MFCVFVGQTRRISNNIYNSLVVGVQVLISTCIQVHKKKQGSVGGGSVPPLTVQHGGLWPHVAVEVKNSIPPQHCTSSPALATFLKLPSHVWLMDTQYRLQSIASLKKALLHSLALSSSAGFDVFQFLCKFKSSVLDLRGSQMAIPFPAPRGSSPHLQFPFFSPRVPLSSLLSFHFAPHPYGLATCVQVVISSALIASQQDGVGPPVVSKSQEGARRRASAMCGICPSRVESANTPHFHTVHIDNP